LRETVVKAIFFVMVSLVFAGIVSTASAQGAGVVVVTQTDAVVKVLKADHQALSEPYFSRVKRGMFREDVQRLPGLPGKSAIFRHAAKKPGAGATWTSPTCSST
jgi:hypothetical protein